MPKVFLMCGKICSGKSTYADKLRKERNAVVLSVDEITLALFGQDAGDKLDYYVEKTEAYLYKKSIDIIDTGINVILDWGFWTKKEREFARIFYTSRNIECEFHYISIDNSKWKNRLQKRNKDVLEGKSNSFYVDEGLAAKFESIFEMPDKDEIDVWIEQ